jgi:hypothetical protein
MRFLDRGHSKPSRSPSAHRSPHSGTVACDIGNLCAQCSVVRVIQFRFAKFHAVFGRKPARDEALFFGAAQTSAPLAASNDEMRQQIAEAADVCGLDLGLILDTLGLSNKARQRGENRVLRPARDARSGLLVRY